jgi:hypothetical protein
MGILECKGREGITTSILKVLTLGFILEVSTISKQYFNFEKSVFISVIKMSPFVLNM